MSVFDGYVRVSKVGGREGDSFISPDEQAKKITGWIDLNGHTLGVLDDTDLDESGAKEIRPGLERLIERIEQGISAGIVVAKLDRFGRNVEQILRNYKRVTDAGGVVVFVAENIDPTTPMGKALMILFGLFAEMQWNQAQEGFLAARINAVERGIHCAAAPPTGYVKGEDRILVVDPVVGPYVTEAFRHMADGMAKADVCTLLNAKGGEIVWTTSLLSTVVKNRAYLGEASSGPDIVTVDAHEALTDPATFAAAQANKRVGPYGKTGALLSGLIRCAGCRRNLQIGWQRVAKGQTRSYDHHAFYGCIGKHHAGRCEAQAGIKASDIERVVMEWFWEVANDKTLVGAVDTAELARAEGELVEAEMERKAWQSNAKLAKLGDAFVEGLEERLTLEETAREMVARVRADLAHPELGDVTSLREVWDDLEPSERHELLASVLGAVYVRKATGKGHRTEPVENRIMIFPKSEEPESPRRGQRKPFPILPLVFD